MNHRRHKRLYRNLFTAILHDDVSRVAALLRSGADPERGDGDGATPLYLASVNGQATIVRLLLAAGARPDTESGGLGSEGTPLCAAACWGHTAAVRELLAHGADPRLREDNGTGRTALEWARDCGHPGTAAVLRAAAATAPGV